MIVVSDLTGTLTTGSPVLGLVSWVKHHQSKLRTQLYMASQAPAYFLAKRGWINYQKWGNSLLTTSLSLVHNATPEIVQAMAEWAVERQLWANRREDVLARLRDHIAGGAQVYIVSSVFQPVVEVFARRIGAQAIGTPVKIANGRLRLATSLVTGERKVEQVLSQVGADKVDIAYGDTWQDIPMLEHASKPVAVYPGQVLKTTAVQRGWEIIGDSPA